MGVRGESIKYGSLKKKEMNNKIKHWEEKIQNQQKELYKEPGNLKALEELELAKNELNLIIESKTRGAIIRSRVQWFEEGEKNSKYFFNLEKRASNMKTIHRLRLQNDSITEDPVEILNEMKNYYKILYTRVETKKHEEFFNDLWGPKFEDNHKDRAKNEITEEEILNVLKKTLQKIKPQEKMVYPPNFIKCSG